MRDRRQSAMSAAPERKTDQYDRRHRRTWRLALIASVVLHVLIFLAFRQEIVIPPSPFAAAGPRAGDDRAAAGGGMEVIALAMVETPPELKGGTATKRPKPARLSTGIEIQVPEYISNGEKIWVSTVTGEFGGRV